MDTVTIRRKDRQNGYLLDELLAGRLLYPAGSLDGVLEDCSDDCSDEFNGRRI